MLVAVEGIVETLRGVPPPRFQPGHICKLLHDLSVRPETLQPYLHFAPRRYTRNLIYRDDLFALLALWLLGAALEQRWGTRRFITFYFLTSVAGALATAVVGIVAPSVRAHPYYGNWSAMEGLIAAFAVLMPDAQIFLYFVPVQAKWMLPISAGITVLFMLMTGWQPYLPQLFGLGAGVLFAGGVSPGNVFLRAKVWWIDRRLRRNRLRVVRGDDVRSGSRGSDKYLH